MRGTHRSCSIAVAAFVLATISGCVHPPQTAYTFDPAPGAWDFSRHEVVAGVSSEEYTHAVHSEHLEIYDVARPPPGTTTAEFNALPPALRTLPTLGEVTSTMRALGDDELGGSMGYWVAQYGRRVGEPMQAAAFVVPSGRRYFLVRLASSEDEIEQMQGWLRDTIMRNFHFPAPQR